MIGYREHLGSISEAHRKQVEIKFTLKTQKNAQKFAYVKKKQYLCTLFSSVNRLDTRSADS